MSKNNQLPDSLELLLDTMCNTFGGVMFIAVSLIIISQMISSVQKSMTAEDVNESKLASMRQNIDTLQQEVAELQKNVFENQRKQLNTSPEIKEAIIQYMQLKENNLQIQGRLDNLKTKNDAEQERINRLNLEITQSEAELKEKKYLLSQKQKQLTTKKQHLENALAELTETLKGLQPRSLRFAREEETLLEPYWVLLKNNKIYRLGPAQSPLPGEVALQNYNFGRSVRMIPQNGTPLGDNPGEELGKLFRDIPKNHYFISLVTDCESFNTLLITRQYLRNCLFMVNWSVNPNFEFSYTNDIRNKASQ